MKIIVYFSIVCFLHIVSTESANRTQTSYDPSELLSQFFNPNLNITSRQRGYGFRFEEQLDPGDYPDHRGSGQYGLISFQDNQQRPVRYDEDTAQHFERPLQFQGFDNSQDISNNGQEAFQDINKLNDSGSQKTKKRRRRRKPKNGELNPGFPKGTPEYPLPGGYGLSPYGYPGVQGGQPYRRPRRPRPSITSEALSAVTEALTSIATYDDYQCVPRLLCEAAGGGALGSNGVLQSIAGIQPLLTLLSAYNGISTSPLFVFGKAVFLGMTSRGNTGTCRYAYPQCPTDPEQLIYYLNNHNGGFFRFFNAPQNPNQNVDQFYHQLSQSYGLHHSNPGENQPLDQNYGYPRPDAYPENQYQYANQRPSLYHGHQNHGLNYAYNYNDYGSNQIRFQDSDINIEKRIQNKPTQDLDDFVDEITNNFQTKWTFPEANNKDNNHNARDTRTLKFPENGIVNKLNANRKSKKTIFSFNQNNGNNRDKKKDYVTFNNDKYLHNDQNYNYNNKYPNSNAAKSDQNYDTKPGYTNYDNNAAAASYYTNNRGQNSHNYNNNEHNMYNYNKYPPAVYNNEEYVFDYKHNFYVKKEKYTNNYINNYNYNRKRDEENGIKTVYVVRGNGDPRNPEIVKLRPGQRVQ